MKDPYFGDPFIDEDVWRDEPVRHRYVHGGFTGTDTRFAFYFPEARHYDGRFVHFLEGGAGGHEKSPGSPLFMAWTQTFGAYYIESNQGHLDLDPGPPDPTILNFRASAESARYARTLAADMYGWAPHHGYLFGGSGGGVRTIYGLEHVFDVWDGGCMFVTGDTTSMEPAGPSPGAVAGLLGPKLQQVVDALEPGGGDPYAGLTGTEADSLRALFEVSGYPRRALFQLTRPSFELVSAPMTVSAIIAADPGFVETFWTEPGHAGADGQLGDRLVDETFVVREVLSADELEAAGISGPFTAAVRGIGNLHFQWVGVKGERPIKPGTEFAAVSILSGRGAGKKLTCYGTFGDVTIVGGQSTAPHGEDLAPGDEIRIDNRAYLAACMRHNYGPMPSGMGFASVSNLPTLPMTGRFHGKIILVEAALDGMIMVRGQVYDQKVREAFGDRVDDHWRLWWVDNTSHTGAGGPPGPRPTLQSRLVEWLGIAKQGLVDLIDWVERGVAPAPSSLFHLEDGQLKLAPTAAERQGLQPLVAAWANGGERADVTVGEAVTLGVEAEATPFGGTLRSIAWDFDGSGTFADAEAVDGSSTKARFERTHSFQAPGTYFPAVRVVSLRPGDGDGGPGPRGYENLARVRVVVA